MQPLLRPYKQPLMGTYRHHPLYTSHACSRVIIIFSASIIYFTFSDAHGLPDGSGQPEPFLEWTMAMYMCYQRRTRAKDLYKSTSHLAHLFRTFFSVAVSHAPQLCMYQSSQQMVVRIMNYIVSTTDADISSKMVTPDLDLQFALIEFYNGLLEVEFQVKASETFLMSVSVFHHKRLHNWDRPYGYDLLLMLHPTQFCYFPQFQLINQIFLKIHLPRSPLFVRIEGQW